MFSQLKLSGSELNARNPVIETITLPIPHKKPHASSIIFYIYDIVRRSAYHDRDMGVCCKYKRVDQLSNCLKTKCILL